MPSFQAKLIYAILRRSWLNNVELQKKNLAQIRKRFTKDNNIKFLFSVSDVTITRTKIDGVGEGLWHVYPLFAKYVPEAQKSINDMVRFINEEKPK